jgi:tetratricopeptide (TPR) repeat protein
MSDEVMRRRLRALAVEDDQQLSPAAQERILQSVLATGPGLVRRGRRERMVWGISGVALAVAAAAALWFRIGPASLEPTANLNKTTEPARAHAPQQRPAARACESRSAPANAAFHASGSGQALDLGTIAYAVTESGSTATLEQSSSCRTVIALDTGRVSIHARDLGGGELVVRARGADVAVRGTVFAVELEGEDVVVEVAEGTVVVNKAGVSDRRVPAGTRVTFAQGLVAESALSTQDRQALLETTLAVPAPAPALDADQAQRSEETSRARPSTNNASERLLSRADTLRRAGDLDGARRLYREAGNGSGPSAEAAWLALARMELAAGDAKAARDATTERQKRFKGGALGPEALWISVRTYRQAGNTDAARKAAQDLVRRWPKSPQAAAAKRWLAEN